MFKLDLNMESHVRCFDGLEGWEPGGARPSESRHPMLKDMVHVMNNRGTVLVAATLLTSCERRRREQIRLL